MDITSSLHFVNTLEQIGVQIPKATLDARAIYTAAGQAAAMSPSDNLRAALNSGEIAAENVAQRVREAALDQSAKSAVQAIARDLNAPIGKAMTIGLREDSERIHSDLASVFNPAAKKVMEAGQRFGANADADQAISLGAKAVTLYQDIKANIDTLTQVSRAYQSLLASITGEMTTISPTVSLYVTGDEPDLDHAAGLFQTPGKWMELASAGFALNLNTASEARGLAAAHHARVAAAEEARSAVGRNARSFRDMARR